MESPEKKGVWFAAYICAIKDMYDHTEAMFSRVDKIEGSLIARVDENQRNL